MFVITGMVVTFTPDRSTAAGLGGASGAAAGAGAGAGSAFLGGSGFLASFLGAIFLVYLSAGKEVNTGSGPQLGGNSAFSR